MQAAMPGLEHQTWSKREFCPISTAWSSAAMVQPLHRPLAVTLLLLNGQALD